MGDDKIKTLYMCQICHAEYGTRVKAEQCVKSHDSDKHICEIELSFYLGNSQKYDFHERKFQIPEDYALSDKIDIFCFYGGYPRLMVECLDTPEEILKAKRRLLAEAYEWEGKYLEVLMGLEQELEEVK